MIYKSSKTLTFVIYEDQKPAKCFEIKKGQIKFLTLLIPVIVVISVLSILFFFSYTKNLALEVQKSPPLIVKRLKEDRGHLLQSKHELQAMNKTLIEKIQSSGESSSILPFFRPILGQEDLTDESPLAIRNLSTHVSGKTLTFHFDLFNIAADQNSKVAGHIFVLMKDDTRLSVFPSLSLNLQEPYLTTFDKGEKFTVTRFRPVDATFTRPMDSSSPVSFKIFVFSRTGDILFQKSIGPVEYQ